MVKYNKIDNGDIKIWKISKNLVNYLIPKKTSLCKALWPFAYLFWYILQK